MIADNNKVCDTETNLEPCVLYDSRLSITRKIVETYPP
jgi:hypothetical protein